MFLAYIQSCIYLLIKITKCFTGIKLTLYVYDNMSPTLMYKTHPPRVVLLKMFRESLAVWCLWVSILSFEDSIDTPYRIFRNRQTYAAQKLRRSQTVSTPQRKAEVLHKTQTAL